MKYRFKASRAFWRSFWKLPIQQQLKAREAFLTSVAITSVTPPVSRATNRLRVLFALGVVSI